MKKWMVYFVNSEGMRDGNEYIWAHNKEEAAGLYKHYFNTYNEECRVIAVFDSLNNISSDNRKKAPL